MSPVEILEAAQKAWDIAHMSAGNKIGNTAADYHLVVQQSGGDAAFELAKSSFSHEATWDEIMAQLAGSVIQDVFLIYFKAPGIITVGLDLIGLKTDVDLGTVTHDLYMQYKYGTQYLRKGEFWDYLTNWEATPNDGVYNPIAYAKVKALRNADGSVTYYKDNATGMYVFQEIYKTEYDHHLATIQAASDLIGRMAFDVQIENSGGVLKVTMPDGTIYAQGDNGPNTIYGASKNDWIYGMGGNDVLYGNSGDDFLDGGTGSDTLVGGTGSDGLVGGSGNDTLIGTNGYGGDDGVADTLNGGDGYDTYIAGNGDTIYDSDGSGIIVFEGKVLHGVDVTMDSTIYPSNQDHTTYYSKVDHGTYYRNGNSGFSFVSDNGHWLNVFTPLDYTEKIIPKPGGGTMKDKTYRGVGVILENFSSPLVLDLNGDGVTSTFIYDTQTYFDLNNDGIRERTAWTQNGDGILVFDKNQDGMINNGNELFGNNTILKNGTKAANGFKTFKLNSPQRKAA